MKKLLLGMVLVSTPVMADTVSKSSPGGTYSGTSERADMGGGPPQANTVGQPQCQPIGKTDKGDLVYSMDCQNVPVPAGVTQVRNPDGSVSVTYPTGTKK